MIEPAENLFNRCSFLPRRESRSVDQENRQAKVPRGSQLCLGPRAAGILGHDQFDPVFLHEGDVALSSEGAAIHDDRMIGQGRRGLWRVHQPQDVVMLRLGGECGQMHPAKRQQNPARRAGQCGDGRRNVGRRVPVIACLRPPRRARQGDQRYAYGLGGGNGIPAHLRGKGMGGIHQMRDGIVPQVGGKAIDTAEPARPGWNGLRLGTFHPPGVGKGRALATFRKRAGKGACFGRATKDEDVSHV